MSGPGYSDRKSTQYWTADTGAMVFSVTKGMASTVIHRLADRGLDRLRHARGRVLARVRRQRQGRHHRPRRHAAPRRAVPAQRCQQGRAAGPRRDGAADRGRAGQPAAVRTPGVSRPDLRMADVGAGPRHHRQGHAHPDPRGARRSRSTPTGCIWAGRRSARRHARRRSWRRRARSRIRYSTSSRQELRRCSSPACSGRCTSRA